MSDGIKLPSGGWRGYFGNSVTYTYLGAGGDGVVFRGPFGTHKDCVIKVGYEDAASPEKFKAQVQWNYLVKDMDGWVKLLYWGDDLNGSFPEPIITAMTTELERAIGTFNDAELKKPFNERRDVSDSTSVTQRRAALDALKSRGPHKLIVQEWAGDSLTDHFQGQKQTNKLSVDTIRKMMFQLAWSLCAANTKYGLVHMDIKPENICIKSATGSPTKRYAFQTGSRYDVFEVQYSSEDYITTIIDLGAAFSRRNLGKDDGWNRVRSKLYIGPGAADNSKTVGQASDIWAVATIMTSVFAFKQLKTTSGQTYNASYGPTLIELYESKQFPAKPREDRMSAFSASFDGKGLIPAMKDLVTSELGETGLWLFQDMLRIDPVERLEIGVPNSRYGFNGVLFHPFLSDAFYAGHSNMAPSSSKDAYIIENRPLPEYEADKERIAQIDQAIKGAEEAIQVLAPAVETSEIPKIKPAEPIITKADQGDIVVLAPGVVPRQASSTPQTTRIKLWMKRFAQLYRTDLSDTTKGKAPPSTESDSHAFETVYTPVLYAFSNLMNNENMKTTKQRVLSLLPKIIKSIAVNSRTDSFKYGVHSGTKTVATMIFPQKAPEDVKEVANSIAIIEFGKNQKQIPAKVLLFVLPMMHLTSVIMDNGDTAPITNTLKTYSNVVQAITQQETDTNKFTARQQLRRKFIQAAVAYAGYDPLLVVNGRVFEPIELSEDDRSITEWPSDLIEN